MVRLFYVLFSAVTICSICFDMDNVGEHSKSNLVRTKNIGPQVPLESFERDKINHIRKIIMRNSECWSLKL